ncbi:MAG TPA: hypothetical protein VGY57_04525 [Vicinamibacterales bacterium]|jgi:hypothetical protein|nr:hypothetical protein [Vicinamibacterales bacterium]
MPGSERWLKVFSLCALLCATSALASAQTPQPVAAPAPSGPDFLSRYDFHLSAAALASGDADFVWDAHFGGSFDIVDYVFGRASVIVDYQAGLGNEPRIFDPNQGTYTLEPSLSIRSGPTEVAAIFHHVSRHLGDRPKEGAIAWNELGVRLMRRVAIGPSTIDVDLEGGGIVQHSFVDYRWFGELGVTARRPVNDHVGVFFQARGQLIGVDELVNGRGTQAGGVAEAGVRIRGGSGGALELFAGIERRIDPWPVTVGSMQWGLAGLRLVSR